VRLAAETATAVAPANSAKVEPQTAQNAPALVDHPSDGQPHGFRARIAAGGVGPPQRG
jgi:hypothetical protein